MPDPSRFDPKKARPEKDFRAPDLLGTVEGWRAWRIDAKLPPFGVAPKLRSATYGGYYWTPRQRAMAECDKCGENVPGQRCSCGFYSAKTLEHLMSMAYHLYDEHEGSVYAAPGEVKVVGQVANWGKVVEGSQGWRAQYSYPVRLFVPYEAARLVKPLRKAYGVPVTLKNILRREGQDPEF